MLWCFLGILGDNKGQNTNIFLKVGAGLGLVVCLFGVPTGPEVGRASRLQDLPDAGGGPLVVCSLPFVRFTALLLLVCLQIWLYFAFLGGFYGVLGVSCGFVLL